MPPILQRIMSNKHTSGAAIFIFSLEGLMTIGALWFPAWFAAHKEQLSSTINELQKLAIGYGLLMGADSPKKPGDDTPPDAKSTAAKIVGLAMLGACAVTFFIKNS